MPFQVSTDEITIMIFQNKMSNLSYDIFSLSDYFGLPSLVFVVTGFLGKLIGGVNLLNMRIVHAVFGLLIIPCSYFLFHILSDNRKVALGGAIILGINHSLIGISRMAMRENIALLFGILALAFLIWGLKKKSFFHTFIGGVFAGLNYYGYYPGRSTIFICFLFLGFLGFFYRKKYKLSFLAKCGGVILMAFVLMILPLITTTAKQFEDPSFEHNFNYNKGASLLFSEGREAQVEWFHDVTNTFEGVKKNIFNGLTTYNNFEATSVDIYHNPRWGFVDPLTGILLWLGVLVVLLGREDERNFLVFLGFLFYLFIFSFVINITPSYARLLVTLPFVCYLASVGLNFLSEYFQKLRKKSNPTCEFQITNLVFAFFLIFIVFLNLWILSDFAIKGTHEGDVVGGTLRYVEDRKHLENYSFYLVADEENMYYHFGNSGWWLDWFGYFRAENQHAQVLSPSTNFDNLSNNHFTIFISKELWTQKKNTLLEKHPDFAIHNILSDGSRIAVEVS